MRNIALVVLMFGATVLRIAAQSTSWQAAPGGRLPALSTPVGYTADGSPLYLARSTPPGAASIGWFDPKSGSAFLLGPDRPVPTAAFEVYAGAGKWVAADADSIPQDAFSAGTGADGAPMYILRVSSGGWLIPAVYSADARAAAAFIGGRKMLFATFEVLVPDWAPLRNPGALSQAFRSGTDADKAPLVPLRAAHGNGLHPGKFNTGSRKGYIPYGGNEIEVEGADSEIFIGSGIWIPSRGTLPPGAIPAGYDDDGSILYMIKARHSGADALGKYSDLRKQAYISWGGAEVVVTSFEVLCYDLGRNRKDSQVQAPIAVPVSVPAQAPPGANVLQNPSAETQPVTRSGWKVASGDWTLPLTLADAGQAAIDGEHFFWPGKAADGELYQDVPIAAFGGALSGSSTVALDVYVSGFPGDPDTAQVVLEARDSRGVVLASADSGPRNNSTWTRVTLTLDLPPATANVRVRLIGKRLKGEDNDAYFDKLSLAAAPAAAPGSSAAPGSAPGWDPVAVNPGFVLPPARVPADFAGRLGVLWTPLPDNLYSAPPSVKAPFALGSLNPAAVQQALAVHNLFRFSAGVPDVSVDAEWSRIAQAGAVLLAGINRLEHTPAFPAGIGMDKAFYDAGYQGTSTSNIHSGPADTGLLDALRGQMDDSYGNNLATLGHRRWLLEPTTSKTGYGQAGNFSTIRAFGPGPRQTNIAAVAWPPAGWVPLDLFVARQAWSISLNPKAFPGGDVKAGPDTRVSITRQRDGRAWVFQAGSNDGSFSIDRTGFGLPFCLIFKPGDLGLVLAGDAYRVEVNGLQDGTGAPIRLAYRTVFFSPEVGDMKLPASAHPAKVTLHVDWQNMGTSMSHADSDQPDTYLNSARTPLVGMRLVVDTPEGVLPVAIQINGQPRLFGPGEWAQSEDGGPIHQFRLVFGGLYHVLQFVGFHDGTWMREYFSPYTLDLGTASLAGLVLRVTM